MERNVFLAAAQALWERGEDGEEIATDLAEALVSIMKEGKGPDVDLQSEFNRLLARREKSNNDNGLGR